MSTPSVKIGDRTIPFTLTAIDRLEQAFGVSMIAIAEQVQSQFERTEVEGKLTLKLTAKSVRFGFAARFLGAIMDLRPDEVAGALPKGQIIQAYAESIDPFFEAVQQLTGSEAQAVPTPAANSTESGGSGPGPVLP